MAERLHPKADHRGVTVTLLHLRLLHVEREAVDLAHLTYCQIHHVHDPRALSLWSASPEPTGTPGKSFNRKKRTAVLALARGAPWTRP